MLLSINKAPVHLDNDVALIRYKSRNGNTAKPHLKKGNS